MNQGTGPISGTHSIKDWTTTCGSTACIARFLKKEKAGIRLFFFNTYFVVNEHLKTCSQNRTN